MILFESNTTKLNKVVKEEPYSYDPLAYLKSQLEATKIAIDYFSESINFDYGEVYKKAGLITESQYEILVEGSFKNAMAKIGRIIRNIVYTIKNAIIGAFKKVQRFFEGKGFQSTIKKFQENDLTKFKLEIRPINFEGIKKLAKPHAINDMINVGMEAAGSINPKDFGSFFDNISDEDLEANLNIASDVDEFLHAAFAQILNIEDGKEIPAAEEFFLKDKTAINGFGTIKSDYIEAYDNVRKAIDYGIMDLEKISQQYTDFEKSFARNTTKEMKENDSVRVQALAKCLSTNKTLMVRTCQSIINGLKSALVEIKRVITEGAKGTTTADDEPIMADDSKNANKDNKAQNESASTDKDLDKEEDHIDDDEPEELSDDKEIEEFAKEDIREYQSLMQEFDHSYVTDFTYERFTEQALI